MSNLLHYHQKYNASCSKILNKLNVIWMYDYHVLIFVCFDAVLLSLSWSKHHAYIWFLLIILVHRFVLYTILASVVQPVFCINNKIFVCCILRIHIYPTSSFVMWLINVVVSSPCLTWCRLFAIESPRYLEVSQAIIGLHRPFEQLSQAITQIIEKLKNLAKWHECLTRTCVILARMYNWHYWHGFYM